MPLSQLLYGLHVFPPSKPGKSINPQRNASYARWGTWKKYSKRLGIIMDKTVQKWAIYKKRIMDELRYEKVA